MTSRPAFTGWSPLRSSQRPRRAAPPREAPSRGEGLETAARPARTSDAASSGALVVAVDDALLVQVRELAEKLLTTVDDGGRRWRHTQAVAERASEAAGAVATGQLNLLLAACWLHDIGYAPAITHTGFHPVDGALHLQRALWPPVLAGLVAHHSGARFMAGVRGLQHLMAPFDRTGYWSGPVADALTWADQTTGPDGARVTAEERIAEVLQRHGPGSPQARSQAQRGPALLAAVRATEERLGAAARG